MKCSHMTLTVFNIDIFCSSIKFRQKPVMFANSFKNLVLLKNFLIQWMAFELF